MPITETDIQQIALNLLVRQGYTPIHGPLLLEGDRPKRSPAEVILAARLQSAIDRLNPQLPADAREEELRKVRRGQAPERN